MFRNICIAGLFLVSTVMATPSLFEFALNINGTLYTPGGYYPTYQDLDQLENVNTDAFNFSSGLGTISVNYPHNSNGDSFIGLYLDLDFDDYTDLISVNSNASRGFIYAAGDPSTSIFDNFEFGALDNSISSEPGDVAVALGWNTFIPEGHHGIVDFLISADKPASGFYIAQSNGSETVYFSSSHRVPEPASMVLLLSGLAGLGFLKIRRKNKFNFIS